MAQSGGQEGVQVLGCSESMTSQNRNLVIRLVQEHLSPRPNEELPGPAFDTITYRTKCILGGLTEGNTAIWQKGKTTAIVATESWECPQFLKSRSGKWILVEKSFYPHGYTQHGYTQDRRVYKFQIYISGEIPSSLQPSYQQHLMAASMSLSLNILVVL